MKADKIYEILEEQKKLDYHSIFIQGPWGIGKTKHIEDFVSENPFCFYVSLFGKSNIDMVAEEIYYEILKKFRKSGKLKGFLHKFKNNSKEINFTIPFINLEVPININSNFINLILNSLETESLIILDDFERKDSKLTVKEVLGFIDALTKNPNLKIVLVASPQNFDEETSSNFKDFHEKVIEKTYTITSYSKDAPSKILGDELLASIEPLLKKFNITNLRTLRKLKLFTDEIKYHIPSNKYNSNLVEDDIDKIALAVIIFYLVHHSKKILMENNKDDKSSYTHYFYAEDEGESRYINDYILSNSLQKNYPTDLITRIKHNFINGRTFDTNFEKLIDTISNNTNKLDIFYGSEDDIKQYISNSINDMKNSDVNDNLLAIFKKLETPLHYADVLGVNHGLEIADLIKIFEENIKKSFTLHEPFTDLDIFFHLKAEPSEFIKNLYIAIKNRREQLYFHSLIISLKEIPKTENHTANHLNLIRQFKTFFYTHDKNRREQLTEQLVINNFFFPIPENQITELCWSICHQINSITKELNASFPEYKIRDKFKSYICSITNGPLLNYRLSIFLKDDK